MIVVFHGVIVDSDVVPHCYPPASEFVFVAVELEWFGDLEILLIVRV